jgi:hypothetical protein
MNEIERDLFHDPGLLITPGILPRLSEFTRELPGLLHSATDSEGTGLLGDPEIAPENPVAWISQLAEVTRAYEAAHQLVQSEDELLGQTMASFGRL